MKVNGISNTCTYMCMYIISTNPFFMGDSKQILHLNKKKTFEPTFTKEATFWALYSLDLFRRAHLGSGQKSVQNDCNKVGPKKPILNGVK